MAVNGAFDVNGSLNTDTVSTTLLSSSTIATESLQVSALTDGNSYTQLLVEDGSGNIGTRNLNTIDLSPWMQSEGTLSFTGNVNVIGTFDASAISAGSLSITGLVSGATYGRVLMEDGSGNLGYKDLSSFEFSPWTEVSGNNLEYTSGSIRTQGMISEAPAGNTAVFTGKTGGVTNFEVLANGNLTAGSMTAHAENNGHKVFLVKNASDQEVYRIYGDGKVEAQEILVDLSLWPDYVFEDSYELRPLEEVASYVEENHHLPEVPSEQEIVENGLNLGEMDAIMMKKIEELTLYIIEQNKRIEEQNKDLLQQNKRIEDLERKLEEK